MNAVCEVRIDNEVIKSEDFVAVVADEKVGAKMAYHTDALTLGMAVQMIASAYHEVLAQLPEEEQKLVVETLFPGGTENE